MAVLIFISKFRRVFPKSRKSILQTVIIMRDEQLCDNRRGPPPRSTWHSARLPVASPATAMARAALAPAPPAFPARFSPSRPARVPARSETESSHRVIERAHVVPTLLARRPRARLPVVVLARRRRRRTRRASPLDIIIIRRVRRARHDDVASPRGDDTNEATTSRDLRRRRRGDGTTRRDATRRTNGRMDGCATDATVSGEAARCAFQK